MQAGQRLIPARAAAVEFAQPPICVRIAATRTDRGRGGLREPYTEPLIDGFACVRHLADASDGPVAGRKVRSSTHVKRLDVRSEDQPASRPTKPTRGDCRCRRY